MKSYDELLALITRRGVHTVFGDYGEGWFIEHNAAELALFLVEMQALSVESVLEIGTGWRAGLSRLLSQDMGWRVTSVDIIPYGHAFDGVTFLTLDAIPDDLGQFDLVMIDGDHTYEAVKADDARWHWHADKVVAFHDIAGLRDCEGVRRYWEEVAYRDDGRLPYFHEIVADNEQRGGIGYSSIAEFNEYVASMDAPTVEPMPEVVKPPPVKPARKPRAKRTTAKK